MRFGRRQRPAAERWWEAVSHGRPAEPDALVSQIAMQALRGLADGNQRGWEGLVRSIKGTTAQGRDLEELHWLCEVMQNACSHGLRGFPDPAALRDQIDGQFSRAWDSAIAYWDLVEDLTPGEVLDPITGVSNAHLLMLIATVNRRRSDGTYSTLAQVIALQSSGRLPGVDLGGL